MTSEPIPAELSTSQARSTRASRAMPDYRAQGQRARDVARRNHVDGAAACRQRQRATLRSPAGRRRAPAIARMPLHMRRRMSCLSPYATSSSRRGHDRRPPTSRSPASRAALSSSALDGDADRGVARRRSRRARRRHAPPVLRPDRGRDGRGRMPAVTRHRVAAVRLSADAAADARVEHRS